MCLIVNKIRHLRLKPKIAKKDILCYKVLTLKSDDIQELRLTSPYMGDTVFSYKSTNCDKKCLIADHFEEHPRLAENKFVIHHAIHSYRKIDDVIIYNNQIVVCAYIPKGTKYWVGKHGEFASERINFIF